MLVYVLRGNYPESVEVNTDVLTEESAIQAVINCFGHRKPARVYTPDRSVGFKVNRNSVYPIAYYWGDGKWVKSC